MSSLFAQNSQELERMRKIMVAEEIVAAGVTNERVIGSMKETPRHEFVKFNMRQYAYFDMALPIGDGQTISPPFVVAYMTEVLDPKPTDTVLEIGTGSGYQAAVLSPLVKHVYSIEIVPDLGKNAAKVLKRLKYRNVTTKVGDGYQGWKEHAPFDKIIVTCSPESVPVPLVEQLKEGGTMVIPLGERYQQSLYLYKKTDGKLVRELLRPTLFVPMTGKAEDNRKVFPDASNPELVNGSFEESSREDELPDGWHYIRQASLVDDKLAPNGTKAILFENITAGRGCRALQAIAIDGSKVKRLSASLWVKLKDIRPGQTLNHRPGLHLTYYDENHGACGQDWLGPWSDAPDWSQMTGTLQVPLKARSAIVRIGLLGGTGKAWFDHIQLKPLSD